MAADTNRRSAAREATSAGVGRLGEDPADDTIDHDSDTTGAPVVFSSPANDPSWLRLPLR